MFFVSIVFAMFGMQKKCKECRINAQEKKNVYNPQKF